MITKWFAEKKIILRSTKQNEEDATQLQTNIYRQAKGRTRTVDKNWSKPFLQL